LDPLRDADPAWVVLTFAIVMLIAIPVLRRLAPAARRHRGGAALLFFGLSLALAIGAIAFGGMGGSSDGSPSARSTARAEVTLHRTDGEDLGATSPELAHELSAIFAARQSALRAAIEGELKPRRAAWRLSDTTPNRSARR
jgi:hypothetical protein